VSDPLRDLWAAVYAASVVQQHAEEARRRGSPGDACAPEQMDRYAGEAETLADLAVEARVRQLGQGEPAPAVAGCPGCGRVGSMVGGACVICGARQEGLT
jgi:hypothetical protein